MTTLKTCGNCSQTLDSLTQTQDHAKDNGFCDKCQAVDCLVHDIMSFMADSGMPRHSLEFGVIDVRDLTGNMFEITVTYLQQIKI